MPMKITRLYTHWEAAEAHTVIEFLDLLRDQLWEIHGEELVDLLREESLNQDLNEHQPELEFDDDIDF